MEPNYESFKKLQEGAEEIILREILFNKYGTPYGLSMSKEVKTEHSFRPASMQINIKPNSLRPNSLATSFSLANRDFNELYRQAVLLIANHYSLSEDHPLTIEMLATKDKFIELKGLTTKHVLLDYEEVAFSELKNDTTINSISNKKHRPKLTWELFGQIHENAKNDILLGKLREIFFTEQGVPYGLSIGKAVKTENSYRTPCLQVNINPRKENNLATSFNLVNKDFNEIYKKAVLLIANHYLLSENHPITIEMLAAKDKFMEVKGLTIKRVVRDYEEVIFPENNIQPFSNKKHRP